MTGSDDGPARIWDAASGALMTLVTTHSGWVRLAADGRHAGTDDALDLVSYADPSERALLPTVWYASDLPELRDPPSPALGRRDHPST